MKLSPKQGYVLELLERPDITEILAGGGAYGGKSRVGSFWLLKKALQYPGSRWLMGRHELKRLKETTLITFLEVCKEQGVQVDKHFRLNLQDNFIHFGNGSRILLADLKYEPRDPEFEDLGSLELTGAFIDEASEITEKAKNILSIRVNRWKNKEYNYTGRILMTCNPHKGWIYSTYYKPWLNGELKPYQAFVPMLALDNPWLEQKYLDALLRLPEIDKQRLFFGNWDYDSDPARLMDYNKIQDLWSNNFVTEGKERFLTCDIAMEGSDKFVVVVWFGFVVKKFFVYEKSKGKEVEQEIKIHAQFYSVPRSNIVFDSDGVGQYLDSYLEGAVSFVNNSRPIEREQETSENGQKEIKALKENYQNLKTQTSFELARMVQANEIYIEDKEYREQIATELSWIKRDKIDDDNKLSILSKKKVKAGLGHSPDFADALHMRMWFKLARETNREFTGASSNDSIMESVQTYGEYNYGIADHY